MIKWNDFNFAGTQYCLRHLWPYAHTFTIPAKNKNPEKSYTVNVVFSLHCFTRGKKSDDSQLLFYSDNREVRTFCFERYNHSKLLPGIINQLDKGKVFHTNHATYLRLDNTGPSNYEVYFTLTKAKQGQLNLFINSAFLRTIGETQHKGKVSFNILALNTLAGKKTKVSRR